MIDHTTIIRTINEFLELECKCALAPRTPKHTYDDWLVTMDIRHIHAGNLGKLVYFTDLVEVHAGISEPEMLEYVKPNLLENIEYYLFRNVCWLEHEKDGTVAYKGVRELFANSKCPDWAKPDEPPADGTVGASG